jgi:hypothetical protein
MTEPPTKYLLRVQGGNGTYVAQFPERPTQDYIKTNFGEGEHTLFNAEGRVLRVLHVDRNRNDNLRITGLQPQGLESLSTLNLQRLEKLYVRVTKIWPAKASDLKTVQKEIASREALIEVSVPS